MIMFTSLFQSRGWIRRMEGSVEFRAVFLSKVFFEFLEFLESELLVFEILFEESIVMDHLCWSFSICWINIKLEFICLLKFYSGVISFHHVTRLLVYNQV